MEKVVNGYKVETIAEYRKKLIADALKNALDAETCGLQDIALICDETAEFLKNRTDQDISCKMIIRGVRRDG